MHVKWSNGDFVYNGIDRRENSIGYTLANCVSCCGPCNMMKKVLSYAEFIERCKRIASKFSEES
jgi:hypothetical protein